jgi:integrase
MVSERFRVVLAIVDTKDRKTKKIIIKWQARVYDRESTDPNKRIKTINLDSPVTQVRGKGESAARIEAEKRVQDLINHGLLSKSLDSDPLVSDYLLSYWKYIPKKNDLRELRKDSRSVTHLKNEYSVIKTHWVPVLGMTRMSKLKLETIDAIMLKWNQEGVQNNSINRRLDPVKSAIRSWAKKNRIPNPLEYLEPATKEPVTPRGVISLEEISKIIDLNISPRLKLAILLGGLCGLRKGEVRGLLWEDVNMEKNIINIRHNWVSDEEGIKDPKFQSFRTVPLPGSIKEILEQIQGISNSQFILWNDKSPTRPVSQYIFNYEFPAILERIGINKTEKIKRKLCFHSLRHTFVSNCRAEGIPDFIVQKMAGHSTIAMTEHYSHGDENVINFAKYREQMDGALAKAGGEK